MRPPDVALRTALVFFAFGAVWVLLSDVTLGALVQDADAVTRLQTVKGWFFIGAASVLVYALAARVAAAEQRERELLRRRSAELAEAQQVARVGHWVLDPGDGGFRCSDELYRILGLDPETKLTYQGFLEAAEPDHSERLANARHRLRTGGESLDTVYPIRLPSGEVRWVQEKVTRQPSREGASRLTGSVADVTELVEGARELQGRASLLEQALATVGEGVLIRRQGRTLDCNAAACRILGYGRAELLALDPGTLQLDGERRDAERRARGSDGVRRTRGRRRSGEAFACELSVVALPEGSDAEGVEIVVFRDAGPFEEDDRGRRRTWERHVTREDERRRMATDLRDGVGEALARLRADLARVRADLPTAESAATRLEEAVATLDDTLGDVRQIADELRPHLLEAQGLVPALETLCADFARRTGAACSLVSDAREVPISPERAVHAYRIVEEALRTAAARVPGASVTVTVAHRGEEVRLEVAGDRPPSDGGADELVMLALGDLGERAELLGGRLAGGPREGGGWSISLGVPVG